MTSQEKHRKELAVTGAITAIFVTLINTFPEWWPFLTGLLPGGESDGASGELYVEDSPNSPIIKDSNQGDCSQQVNGNNNTVTGSNICSDTHNHNNQSTNTFNHNSEWSLDASVSSEVNQSNTYISESTSTSLSFHATAYSWLAHQALLAVTPTIEGPNIYSGTISSTSSSYRNTLAQKAFLRRMAAGIRNGSIDAEIVSALGYNLRELVPELIVFNYDDFNKSNLRTNNGLRSLNEGSGFTKPSSRNKGFNKARKCWNATVPSNGSDHCKPGNEVF